MNDYLDVLKKYTLFTGRAGLREFWMFSLFNFIIAFVLSFLPILLGIEALGLLYFIYILGVLLPSLAVATRRLHDTDRSGWWQLIGFIPLIGIIILLVLLALKGQEGKNRFGPATA
ncbi:MAG TPA: DUF805 domain-containing protein [Rhodospirillaceae bacterium]|nr:DUF805 domain-containing protein [Rhodospirillaceae bacterium]